MFTKILGKNVNYQVRGAGKPLILVHGWGGSIDSLKSLSKLASRQGFQTITLDLPGFGKSEIPESTWGVAEYAAIIRGLLAYLKIEQVDYFGHSFGGSLGIYLAVKYPRLINHLILCDSSFKRTRKTQTTPIGILFNNLPLPQKSKQILKKIIYRIFFPDSDLPNFPELETNYKKIMTEDLTCRIQEITQPTLILWGETDQQTPLNLGEELAQKIPKSRLKIFPAVGHNLPLKYPDSVFKDLQEFLC